MEIKIQEMKKILEKYRAHPKKWGGEI